MLAKNTQKITGYDAKKRALSEQLRASRKDAVAGSTLRLSGKRSSNLFRPRTRDTSTTINVRDFNHVISIDTDNLTADVEGMTTYEDFVNATLEHNLLPTVVPELKSITVGGAVTGIGIESSSFKFGLVHETILEMDILLGNGDVITCTPTNEHKDLFFGFPNSYGTFGYALRLKVQFIKAKRFVKLERKAYSDPDAFFQDLKNLCLRARKDGSVDYVDGVAFDRNQLSLITGTFVDDAPFTSDYTFKKIYYKSIPDKPVDYLTAHDYIWRWDTDWFWCSRFFGAEIPFIRRLLGRDRLRSTTYWKIRNFFGRPLPTKLLELLKGRGEPIIQDVEIPINHAANFLQFFHDTIGIKPVWICPTMPLDPARHYDLYGMDASTLYINFGFWDGVKSDKEEGYYNRLIEREVATLHGKKSLYSTSYYTPEEFWSLYNKPRYDELKRLYDPTSALKNLYQKCVLRK